LRTNLTGGFLMAREVYVQWMKQQRGGAIVNMIADMWNGMPQTIRQRTSIIRAPPASRQDEPTR
jgi:NAD(P)-dependent dehydrogenase (short-subunit alcohol dehydrogenase family)